MRRFLSALAIFGFMGAVAYAQVPVTDAANIKESVQIKELSRQIQSDTSIVKDNTMKTLQAVTGDRTQDASQFSNLATGQGFSMSQAPDFASILQGNQSSFGGIGGVFQNNAAQLINGLNLVKSLVDQFKGGATANSKSYDQAVQTLTTMMALTDAMNSSAKQRTNSFQGATEQIGRAQDMKGALEQNTQMVLQGNQTTNEAVGSLNNQVHLLSEQQRAGVAAMSERNKALAPINASGSGDQQGNDVGSQLKAFQERQSQ